MGAHGMQHLLHAAVAGGIRAEVPCFGAGGVPCQQALPEHEITGKAFENVLPGAGSVGRTYLGRFAACRGANDVRNQPIIRPVAAADDIAGARSGDQGCVLRRKKGLAVAGYDELGRGFRGAVGVVSAKRIVLAVAPRPFMVLVDLVGRHHDDGLHVRSLAAGIEQVCGADDIGGPGFQRRTIGATHQRLCRQMEHDLGPGLGYRCGKLLCIADIEANVAHGQLQQIPVVGPGLRVQRNACKLCAKLMQPQGKPTAFEAGMAGHQHASSGVSAAESLHVQTFQGARPAAQRSSRWFLSRSVSMGCQKPRC